MEGERVPCPAYAGAPIAVRLSVVVAALLGEGGTGSAGHPNRPVLSVRLRDHHFSRTHRVQFGEIVSVLWKQREFLPVFAPLMPKHLRASVCLPCEEFEFRTLVI